MTITYIKNDLVMNKINVPVQGYLARNDIRAHTRIQRLLSESKLSGLSCTAVVEKLPRPQIKAHLDSLREKEALRKTLLLGTSQNHQQNVSKLRELNNEIQTIRDLVSREISKNTLTSEEAFRHIDQEIMSQNSPKTKLNSSVLDLIKNQDRKLVGEMIKREGLESFILWYLETFRNDFAQYTKQWMEKLRSEYLQSMSDIGVSISHLLDELKRPRFYLLQSHIRGEIRLAYAQAETQLLREHRGVLAQILDFVNQCIQDR